eukprot:GDKI01004752.1.p3 GENE.GDKI01004752.1~~GDKI01004752.1.p3  ORF type:complete len:104 (+),score=16.39 GDKI01004752.1:235-546(+)
MHTAESKAPVARLRASIRVFVCMFVLFVFLLCVSAVCLARVRDCIVKGSIGLWVLSEGLCVAPSRPVYRVPFIVSLSLLRRPHSCMHGLFLSGFFSVGVCVFF